MKKTIFICVVAVAALLSSCASTYHYCQVYETKPVKQENHYKKANGDFCYENEHCIIDYNFWANGGSADFGFYNKTDEIIYVDLAKSFYMMNGVAYDLYQNREWTQSSSVGVASSVSYGSAVSRSRALSAGIIEPSLWSDGVVSAKASRAASRSSSVTSSNAVARTESSAVTVKEKQIIAIPPHGKKTVKTYNINTSPMLSCDLQRYPAKSARLDFSADNSPFLFSEVVTYSVGDKSQPVTLNNEFYVSSITNYAEPEIVEMKKREEPCENMQDPDYSTPLYDLYDKFIRDSICETSTSFYNTYSKTTAKKLYEKELKKDYSYDSRYNAFVKKGAMTRKNVNRGSNAVLGGLVAGVGVLLLVVALVAYNVK